MNKPPFVSKSYMRWTAALVVALGAVSAVVAQPANNSANQFGDRQTGHWGDPANGYFGNPAIGDFDKSMVREPPPGARPLGRVSGGKKTDGAPYITLPAPTDAVEPESAPKKQPAKKRAAEKTG
ncbi:MAG: hypothetical protein Q7J29_03950 [Stagnimonas sp.]|nr:hypothetical protein [Stagnimonas sp.]